MTTWAEAPSLNEDSARTLSGSASEPQWLLDRRLAALRAYNSMSMPNPLEEEWRRTDVTSLDLEADLARFGETGTLTIKTDPDSPAATQWVGSTVVEHAADATDLRLVQIDGRSGSTLDQLPKGVIFCDLTTAARDHADLLQKHLNSLVQPAEWKLQALSTALRQNGAFIYVPANVEVAVPLEFLLSSLGTAVFSHLLIVAGENSSVTVVQETHSPDAVEQTLAVEAIEIIAGAHARVSYLDVQRWGSNVYNFSTIRARLDRGAELTTALLGLGSRLTKTHLDIHLDGEASRANLLGLSLGEVDQHFDYNTLQEHTGSRTASDLLFKAALNDRASEVWYGTVRIEKSAHEAEASQTSRNLLLSEHAKAAPIPVLEIEAFDVQRCSHGASAGPLDEEQRFYLESRGIPKPEAEKLLVEAFFQEVIDRLPAARVREQVEKSLKTRIERREAK